MLYLDNEFQFVINDTKLQKLAPKVWKFKDCSVDEPLLTFYFRVQYYVDSIGLLKYVLYCYDATYYSLLRLVHFTYMDKTKQDCLVCVGGVK